MDAGRLEVKELKRINLEDLIASNTRQLEKAGCVLPGGVNSSVRVHGAIGVPFFVSRSDGALIYDLEGNEYLDMCNAHGAALLGHRHPAIVEAVSHAAELGFANVFETPYHEELARKVCEAIPCADMVRFCSSGSEATLHMIRACREYSGRDKIIRVEGHFHGYHELIYIGGHPPKENFAENRTHPYIESEGIPEQFADLIIPIPFNDAAALEKAITRHAHEAGTLILEPVNFNSGGIMADLEYLKLARRLTAKHGMVLFFDEVQSAFKKSAGGAQFDFGVIPDVATIGKSLGGGLPLSAFCGRRDIMSRYKPLGPVQHSGTFNGHLVPVLSGLAFMNEIAKPYFYPRLVELENLFQDEVDRIIRIHDLNMVVPHHGARFGVVLGRRETPKRYEDTFAHDRNLMNEIWRSCLELGVYFHDYGGAPVHHGFSIQYANEDIEYVLSVLEEVLPRYKGELDALLS